MGSCIICGTSVDGRICDLHEEDVVFEFRGSSPDQLTIDRFYRGTVDGYAEFGVFIDIGDSVTGLLHRSELDQRLESLDWEPGDTVFVQVQQVRDNGNIDLGWSIRQDESEFRGMLVDDAEQGETYVKDDGDDDSPDDGSGHNTETDATETGSSATETGESVADDSTSESASTDDSTSESASTDDSAGNTESDASGGAADGADAAETGATGDSTASADAGSSGSVGAVAVAETEDVEHVAVGSLSELVGDTVRIEGVVENVHQTSGPTVFEIRDETGSIECAAFKEAGVRAYPEIGADDVVRLDGEVRERRSELQVETEALVKLDDDEREAVEQRLEDAITERAEPDAVEPLVADSAVEALADDIREVATAIRRAVIEERPVIVRHTATADGYVGGVAIERATLPLVRDQHDQADAVYHYFDRRPLEDGVYDMDDATNDVTGMLDARERHGEKLPLFVFVAAGATRESLDGFELLDLYGAEKTLVDDVAVDPEVEASVAALATPAADAAETTATTIAANVAAHVDESVRADLEHLPAVSFWEDTPEGYVEAAENAGYDADDVREIREAVALEAFYQSYEDKRELITDLLFGDGDGPGGLASHVSEQFREKLDAEVETAEANIDHRTVDDATIAVLDTDAFTHRYEFPPTELLLDELHRRHRDEVDAVIGIAEDELHIRSDTPVDVRDVTDRAREWAPSAGLTARSARDGKLEFLVGERETVLDAVVDVVADEVA